MPIRGSLLACRFLPQVRYLPNSPFTLWILGWKWDEARASQVNHLKCAFFFFF